MLLALPELPDEDDLMPSHYLDAVFKRLRDKGLADLCLEAHSHKATKKEVLDQLGRALDARTTPECGRAGPAVRLRGL